MPYIMCLRIPNMFRYTEVLRCEYRMISNSSIVQMDKIENVVSKKLNELMLFYEEITGMHEVRAAQDRVLQKEKKLAAAQDHRRAVNNLVKTVQAKLRELRTEMDTTSRGEDIYVRLMLQEHGLLKEERKLVSDLQQFELEEREHFTALSSAVKDSHEKERAQAQRTKYWSIIGSIIGTVIGIVGSGINNHFKFKKFQNIVKETIDSLNVDSGRNIPQLLHKQEEQFSQIVAQIKALGVLPSKSNSHMADSGAAVKMDKLLKLLDQQQAVLQSRFKELEVLIRRSLASGAVENVRKPPQSEVQRSIVPATSNQPPTSQASEQDETLGLVLTGTVGLVLAVLCSYCCCR